MSDNSNRKPPKVPENIYERHKVSGANKDKQPRTLKESQLYRPQGRSFTSYCREIIEGIEQEDQQHTLQEWQQALLTCNEVINMTT